MARMRGVTAVRDAPQGSYDDFAVSTFPKTQQIVWAVAIRRGLEIVPVIVCRHNNVRTFTIYERIERVLSIPNSADGIVFS